MADSNFSDLPLFAQHLHAETDDSAFVPMAIPTEGLQKICTRCKKKLSLSHFYQWKTGRIHAECKDCSKEYVRLAHLKYGSAYKAQKREYIRWRRAVIKEAVFQAYGGWVCACCGETERLFLNLDHIENNGAEERRKLFGRISGTGYRMYDYLFRHDCPPGYQVLCANCNHGKYMNNGTCPHQATANDYPVVGVEPSGSKRMASSVRSGDDDIVYSEWKHSAVLLRGRMK